MHTNIVAIVYANDKKQALLEACSVFTALIERGLFDEFTPVNEHDVVKAGSKQGKRLIEDRMQATRNTFDRAITMVREGINCYSNDELYSEYVPIGGQRGMFRYWCSLIGKDAGYPVLIYDNDASGIRSDEHLEDALSKWELFYDGRGIENPDIDKEVWVVPTDVHW